MRVLLLADVHANWDALLALQRAEQKPDAVLFAGDAVGYGPDPANCARWLLTNTTAAVRGNHDAALQPGSRRTACDGVPPELAAAAQETLASAARSLTRADRDAIGSWPLSASIALGGTHFHLVHSSPPDPLGGAVNPATCPEAELQTLFGDIAADVIVLGHTHMPAIRCFGGRWIINPGSLGQPRYGTPDATYGVWEDGQFQIKHLHYDHDATASRLRLARLSAEVAGQLAAILETGMIA